jgi:hypothetical protein
MQDLVQLSLEDEDVAELFEGVAAGSKIKMTLEVTVSEVDEERLVATLDEVHDDVDILDELEDSEEEDYEEEEDGDEEDEEDAEYTEA